MAILHSYVKLPEDSYHFSTGNYDFWNAEGQDTTTTAEMLAVKHRRSFDL